jgi:KaiC/GvpD/RAD55 family RecA-like ATPase
MSRLSGLSLGDADDMDLPLEPRVEGVGQSSEALFDLKRDRTDFLHLPFPSLDSVVGGIGKGEVWFVGAYSGHGKTTFLTSALDAWFDQGKGIYFMGLESRPKVLRTHWACKRLGLDAGDVLSGKASLMADWEFQRKRLSEEIKSQVQGETSEQVYFSPRQFVDPKALRAAGNEAKALDSDILIIDHVDHLSGTFGNLYQQSVEVMKTLLAVAQEFEIRVLAATQFNNEMIKGTRLGLHHPPTPTAVYMGGHKRQIATGMLGLYRPIKFGGLTKEESTSFMRGELEPKDICEPNTMAVSVMKHRLYGDREGKRVFLRVERGKVMEIPGADLGPIHGIRTNRDYAR